VLDFIDGYVFLAEETREFITRNLVSRLSQYAETLKTPFFGTLVDYAEEGNQLWTCPGHNGGTFYSRSPIGRIFKEHLGEAIFRDDLDNSILELGDLLTHEGPALQAQKEAAAIFGAERTYFVLNGTSVSNKIALSALIADGDLVLFEAAVIPTWSQTVRRKVIIAFRRRGFVTGAHAVDGAARVAAVRAGLPPVHLLHDQFVVPL
jgi:ornithine decarboxylase